MDIYSINNVFVFIISVADCIISIKFLSAVQEKAFKKYWLYFTAAFMLIYSLICSTISRTSYFMAVSLAFHIIVSVLLFKGKILMKLYFGIIVVVLGGISEAVSGFTIAVFARISFEEVMRNPLLYLTAAVTSKILLILVLNTILRLRKSNEENIPFKYWFVLISVPMSSFVLANVNAINDYNYSYDRLTPILLTLLIMIFINVVIFVIFDEMIRTVELEKARNAFSRQFNKQQEYYKKMIDNNTNTRSILHDMNNHFIMMQNFLALNEIDKVKKYLADLTKQVKANGTVIKTGNIIIDCLVSEKKNFASRSKCDLNCNIMIPENLDIEPVDLCIILGNALDNAIEECQRIEDDSVKKEIVLKMICKNDQLFISVANPMSGKAIVRDGRFVTIKPDARNHGFGLKNIESVVQKYDGILDILTENNIFKLNIALKTN